MSRSFPAARLVAAAALVALAIGCSARKRYPDPSPGWSAADYSVVFGRLQRMAPPAATPDAPPAWVIRFAQGEDGLFALTPPERFVGYSGGERVEIRGRRFQESTADQFNGRWYVVDSIRLWESHR